MGCVEVRDTDPAVIQPAIERRLLQVRPGREVHERHTVPGAGIRVQDVRVAAIAKPLAELGRHRYGVVAAPVRHPDHLAEGRAAAGGCGRTGGADGAVERAALFSRRDASGWQQVGVAYVELMRCAGVEQVDRADDTSSEPMIYPERHLDILRESHVRIEKAEAWPWPRSVRTGAGLVDRIELRDVRAVARQEQFLGAVVSVGIGEPGVRGATAEETDATPQEGPPLAPEVVVDAQAWRPKWVIAREPAGIDAQGCFQRIVRRDGVRQDRHVHPKAGGESESRLRIPAILHIQTDPADAEGDATGA